VSGGTVILLDLIRVLGFGFVYYIHPIGGGVFVFDTVQVLAPDLIRLLTKIENESNTITCDTRATSKRDNGGNIRGTRQTGMESTRN
jgi:hypothetical protein